MNPPPMKHRPTFRRKADLRKELDAALADVYMLRTTLAGSRAAAQQLLQENVQLRTLRTELEGQVQVQSTLVTNAKVAAQESHKGYEAMKRQYQSAYDRSIQLQEEIYFLQATIDNMNARRPWYVRSWRWLGGLLSA